jgi:hypothetical protein
MLPSRERVRAALVADGYTSTALENAELTQVTENRKIYQKLLQEHHVIVGKAFAGIINTLTQQGKAAVRAHADFATARATDDLIKLKTIICRARPRPGLRGDSPQPRHCATRNTS